MNSLACPFHPRKTDRSRAGREKRFHTRSDKPIESVRWFSPSRCDIKTSEGFFFSIFVCPFRKSMRWIRGGAFYGYLNRSLRNETKLIGSPAVWNASGGANQNETFVLLLIPFQFVASRKKPRKSNFTAVLPSFRARFWCGPSGKDSTWSIGDWFSCRHGNRSRLIR